ncbi:MAG: hypothetical protein HA494_07770 [Thaumarchaeota archaeon]|nr:hypothetical protein [Nitrososphaerota archaeon]
MKEDLLSIPTGVRGLDRMLLGGLQLGAVYDFFGASGVGKTQLCLQVSTIASAPKEQGGFGCVVLYVDPTGSFRPERLKEIAEERSLDSEKILSQVYLYEPRLVEEQIAVLNQLKKMSKKPTLIVIDGVTDLFLSDHDMVTRALLGSHLHSLCLTALKEGIAILLTNPVRERLGAKEATVEAGGNIMAQGAHFRVKLSKKMSGLFLAEAVQPPLRPREVYYKITRAGLVDA